MNRIGRWKKFRSLTPDAAREVGRRIEMILSLLFASLGVALFFFGVASLLGGSLRESLLVGCGAALAFAGFTMFRTNRDRQ